MENLSLIKKEVFKNINKNKINAIVIYGSRSRGDYQKIDAPPRLKSRGLKRCSIHQKHTCF
ncbi:hypothetical protein J4416_02350 [Candidatus Pacearchaeota archaeon]|nr:hypothetical protein [Candidatus Pacearchaeota archaeon]